MDNSKALGALIVLVAAGAALYAQQSQASTGDSSGSTDYIPPLPEYPQTNQISPYDPFSLTPDVSMPPSNPQDNINAFLATIKEFESRGNYNALYGGGTFDDFSKHPNVHVPFHNPNKAGSGNNDYSTAAGAYQINYPTYTEFAAKTGLYDFSPETQDAMALAILKTTGAVDSINRGDIQTAFVQASKRWASLPGSTSGQSQKSITVALNTFANNGGIA